MTNEDIEKLIDSINNEAANDSIFLSVLSQTVDFAKVWTKLPEENIGNESSYPFYFIKSEEGNYVGAVSDMGNDLHVYVKTEHRKKGYLSRAISEVILPHLFQVGREKQRITFIDPTMGEYVKRNWGFTITGDGAAEKDLSCYKGMPTISHKPRKITYDEFKLIKKKIDRARLYIIMASEHVESMFGKHNDAGLSEYAHDILYLDDEVLNYIEDQQGPLA